MSRRGEERLSRTLGSRIVGVMGFNKAVIRDIYDDDFSDFQAQQIVLMALDFNTKVADSLKSHSGGTAGAYLDVVVSPIDEIQLIPGMRVDLFAEGTNRGFRCRINARVR